MSRAASRSEKSPFSTASLISNSAKKRLIFIDRRRDEPRRIEKRKEPLFDRLADKQLGHDLDIASGPGAHRCIRTAEPQPALLARSCVEQLCVKSASDLLFFIVVLATQIGRASCWERVG